MVDESSIIFYNSPKGNVHIEVLYKDETFWMTQKRISELFGVAVPAISTHLKNIFESGELQESSVVSKMETTAVDGKAYLTAYYPILQDKGKVSALEAKLKAEQEFEVYHKIQDERFISDFDREVKRLEGK
jgi:hypothetical protein